MTRVDEAWVEVPLGDEWVAAYALVLQQGYPVIAEVRIFPAEPKRPGAGQWSGHFLGVNAAVPSGGVRRPMPIFCTSRSFGAASSTAAVTGSSACHRTSVSGMSVANVSRSDSAHTDTESPSESNWLSRAARPGLAA